MSPTETGLVRCACAHLRRLRAHDWHHVCKQRVKVSLKELLQLKVMAVTTHCTMYTDRAMDAEAEEKEGEKLYTWETKYERTWYNDIYTTRKWFMCGVYCCGCAGKAYVRMLKDCSRQRTRLKHTK